MTRIKQLRLGGLMLLFLFTVLTSCRKGKPADPSGPPGALPVLTTKPVTINANGFVESGGVITNSGDLTITERDICWSTSPAPAVSGQKALGKTMSDDFLASPSGLLPNTTYYFRAYATNSKGTAYGNEVSYKAGNDLLLLKATWWGEAKTTIGLLQGIRTTMSGPGLSTLSTAGICWSTKPNPTMSDSVRITTRMENPLIMHTSLLPVKTKYYARAFAINKTDTVYSNEVTFETPMKIGYLHAGGIILTLNDAKTAGTVLSRYALDNPLPWAPENMTGVPTGAGSQTDGASNTDKIIAAYGTGKLYAAKACRDYRGGGFSDWYLPSKQELEVLRKELSALNISWDIFRSSVSNCWSSTELSSTIALHQDFETPPKNQPEQVKSGMNRVIPVRTFKD
ncbi:hypothetical protein [Daejeonella sp. JGW-45]|uniref:hypothetical protein n=1 Tax=Daejeonella sp. JGW-45 TaxID=3034148 RepID=UPI0023EAF36D|nr:hypothetical protein [Daejeonella sp. JGW-45]